MARPRKQDELNIPEKAVKAAIHLINSRNCLDFTMAEIAREVGCSAPALYNHFADKDELLRIVQSKIIKDSRAEKQARYSIHAKVDAFANLREGGLNYVKFARDNPVIYRLVYGHFSDNDEDNFGIPRELISELAKGIRACQAQGLGFFLDPEKTAKLLWSAVHGAVLLAMDAKFPGDEETRWREAFQVVDTVMDLLNNHQYPAKRG